MTHRATSLIERLTNYQDRALDVASRAEALLAKNDPALASGLAQTRWELLRALMPYAAFKHGEMFPVMIDRSRPEQLVAATQLRQDCLALGEEVKAYVARWSSVSVPDHWTEYRAASLAITARIRAHMARERRAAEAILQPSADRWVPPATSSTAC